MERGQTMATNNKDYMRRYQAARRGRKAGFRVDLALCLHRELLSRGICKDDARWAVLDAAARGVFGTIPAGVFGRAGRVR